MVCIEGTNLIAMSWTIPIASLMPSWPYGVVYVGPFWLLLVVFPTLNSYCNIFKNFE